MLIGRLGLRRQVRVTLCAPSSAPLRSAGSLCIRCASAEPLFSSSTTKEQRQRPIFDNLSSRLRHCRGSWPRLKAVPLCGNSRRRCRHHSAITPFAGVSFAPSFSLFNVSECLIAFLVIILAVLIAVAGIARYSEVLQRNALNSLDYVKPL